MCCNYIGIEILPNLDHLQRQAQFEYKNTPIEVQRYVKALEDELRR